MSDKNIESIGNTFIRVYGAELKKQHDKTKKEFEGKREEYKLKREAQGINTIEQMAEWASEYSPSPTLKAWLLYKWEKFKVRTDKWSMLQWQLVIIGITACIFFSSMHQKMTMDLDRTNRLFYKNVIINEKRNKDYQEQDSLIHSNSFFKTYWTLEH